MAEEDPGYGTRWILLASIVLGVLTLSIRIAVLADSVAAGVGAGAALALFAVVTRTFVRRHADRKVWAQAGGPPTVDGLLDFSCLPGDWPSKARDTMGAFSGPHQPGLPVTVSAAGGHLTVDRKMAALTAKHPFSARVPLRAVRRVRAGTSRMTLGGTSLSFDLASGEQLRVDLSVGSAAAARAAESFREALPVPTSAEADRVGIEVTSPPPPAFVPFGRAWLMVVALVVPFTMAMAGASTSAVAAVISTFVLVLGLVLLLIRPPATPRILGAATSVLGLAFVVDAAMTGQAVRLVGTASCALIAVWLLGGFGSPGTTAT